MLLEKNSGALTSFPLENRVIPLRPDDGVNGFLCHVNDISSMAECLGKLVDDDKLRIRMGQLARQRIKYKFSIRPMVEQYEKLYYFKHI